MKEISQLIRLGGIHTAAQGENFPLHQDDFWELMYVRSGHIICRQGEYSHTMYPGMAILHPPRVYHADYALTAYTTYYIWIDAPENAPWPCLYYDDEAHSLERVCETAAREWRGQGAEREEMLALLTGQIRVLLHRAVQAPEKSLNEHLVVAAEQIMEECYREALTVGEIARRVNTSASSLYGHFAELRAETPMAHLQRVRMRHALSLLYHSTLTLETIAETCGYYSASHLSRHVKAATGASPGQLRPKALLTSSTKF